MAEKEEMTQKEGIAQAQKGAGDRRMATFLARLKTLNAGENARLKRKAGRPLAEAGDALGLFYRLLPAGVEAHQEERYFLIATLYPIADAGAGRSLGAALARAQNGAANPGLDRRMEILLDADMRQLPFRLRQALRFLASKNIPVPWATLGDDLLRWESPERTVQKRWARDYFGKGAPALDAEAATAGNGADGNDTGGDAATV